MLKMEMKQGSISLFEMDGNGPEVAADICVLLKRCADEFAQKKDFNGFLGYMAAMGHTLSAEWFNIIFGIDPPSKYKAGDDVDYKVGSDESEQ